MIDTDTELLRIENHSFYSGILGRKIHADSYFRPDSGPFTDILLINDGQDLISMGFDKLLSRFLKSRPNRKLLCIGIHSNSERKHEYGIAGYPDYKGRGERAGLFSRCIIEELFPFIRKHHSLSRNVSTSYAGFSLGGLSAFDIAWNHPGTFDHVGVFSGSFWWRDMDSEAPGFDEQQNRILHRRVREGRYHSVMKFFFEAGGLDEKADRNKNGIIDSIDDTLDLIRELKNAGCPVENICYLELPEGKHDLATWAEAFPSFLEWCFSK